MRVSLHVPPPLLEKGRLRSQHPPEVVLYPHHLQYSRNTNTGLASLEQVSPGVVAPTVITWTSGSPQKQSTGLEHTNTEQAQAGQGQMGSIH